MIADLLQTASGRGVPLGSFGPEHVDPVDIAHALAHLCRFGGHTRVPYSVAEHSVRVAHQVWILSDEDPKLALYGLLHDAAEAYLGDVVTPLKTLLAHAYGPIEWRVQDAIYAHFGLDRHVPEVVHQMDRVLLVTELRDLMASPLHEGWFPVRHVRPLPARIAPLSAEDARTGWLRALDFYRAELAADDPALREQVS